MHSNNRVLVVDDDDSILSTYQQVLSPETIDSGVSQALAATLSESVKSSADQETAQYRLQYANSGEQAIQKVEESLRSGTPFAVVLMDIRMPPGMNGLEAADRIRRMDSQIYIVFVSAYSDYSAEEMHQKIDKNMMLIHKPFSDDVLVQTVRMLCTNWGREHYLMQAYSQLQTFSDTMVQQATRDGLTGLYNRHFLNESLENEVMRARREQLPMGLLMVDIDRFKWYNDHYGHLQGDRSLHAVAQLLCTVAKRPADLVARFGGEEFCLVLPNTDLEGVKTVAANICAELALLKIDFPESDVSSWVTVSIGGVSCTPQREDTSNLLLSIADRLLYDVKNKGRNGFLVEVCSDIPASESIFLDKTSIYY